MRTTFTTHLSLATLALLMAASIPTQAQDVELVGYTNVWTRLQATPDGGGQVCATTTANGLKTWKGTVDFQQTVQVGSILGTNVTMFYAFARPTDGYTFVGWYDDTDGNGLFDPSIDEQLDTAEEYIVIDVLGDDAAVYTTQAEAKSGTKPTAVQHTIFAYFTHGATIGVTDYQGDGLNGAQCGSVFVDKPVNEPGDVVTARALPNDGFQFEYWQSKSSKGDIVSRENPYQFTVQGGERLYAYFTAIDAPRVELPAEGGFAVLDLAGPWVMTDESMKAGAHILVMEAEDLTRTADGKTYLDMSREESHIDIGQASGLPTIVYGKGTVSFAFKMTYGYARKQTSDALVHWSGASGATVKGENLYIYAFRPEVGAFIAIGNTDQILNPTAATTFRVPARQAYFSMSAFDLVDSQGNIPAIIGLSPETCDQALAGIDDAQRPTLNVQHMYDLQGRQLRQLPRRGLYISGGKKFLIK